MSKYHISKNGKPALCRATVKPCPLGGDEVHYNSIEEAQKAADEKLKNEHSVLANNKQEKSWIEQAEELISFDGNGHIRYIPENHENGDLTWNDELGEDVWASYNEKDNSYKIVMDNGAEENTYKNNNYELGDCLTYCFEDHFSSDENIKDEKELLVNMDKAIKLWKDEVSSSEKQRFKNHMGYDRVEIMKDFLEENLSDWGIYISDGSIDFSQHSPAGQDFSFSVDFDGDIDSLISNVEEYAEYYDVEENAELWSEEEWDDDVGDYVRVGQNGAPSDYDDLLEDMEWCKNAARELAQELEILRDKF